MLRTATARIRPEAHLPLRCFCTCLCRFAGTQDIKGSEWNSYIRTMPHAGEAAHTSHPMPNTCTVTHSRADCSSLYTIRRHCMCTCRLTHAAHHTCCRFSCAAATFAAVTPTPATHAAPKHTSRRQNPVSVLPPKSAAQSSASAALAATALTSAGLTAATTCRYPADMLWPPRPWLPGCFLLPC
jgi:hypothetical protein